MHVLAFPHDNFSVKIMKYATKILNFYHTNNILQEIQGVYCKEETHGYLNMQQYYVILGLCLSRLQTCHTCIHKYLLAKTPWSYYFLWNQVSVLNYKIFELTDDFNDQGNYIWTIKTDNLYKKKCSWNVLAGMLLKLLHYFSFKMF